MSILTQSLLRIVNDNDVIYANDIADCLGQENQVAACLTTRVLLHAFIAKI